jgi:hypothetical protein
MNKKIVNILDKIMGKGGTFGYKRPWKNGLVNGLKDMDALP